MSGFDSFRTRADAVRESAPHGSRRLRHGVDTTLDPREIPLASLNVANPDLFKHDAAFAYFARLREEAPVHYCAESQYGPYWSITRYHDIMAVDRDHENFSSDFSLGGVTLMGTPSSSTDIPMFIAMDPPVHQEQRKAVAPRFTQKSLQDLEQTVRQRVITILDALPRNEPFNWVERVSIELTAQMLATLLDVPQADRYRLIEWSNVFANADNPELVSSKAEYFEALAACGEYFQALWQDRLVGQPGDDLISMLAHGDETRDMSSAQLLGNVILLVVGGNDTTRNSISGGLLALHDFPEQQRKLRENPHLVHSMVPEIIRWQTPLMHMRRTARRDVTLHDQQIREGDKVVMWYLSGNRDPRAIEKPEEFIVDRRRPREHLSFGFGIHRCLGNRVAELQLRVLWEEILRRQEMIEVVGAAERVSSCLFRAIQRLPVIIRA